MKDEKPKTTNDPKNENIKENEPNSNSADKNVKKSDNANHKLQQDNKFQLMRKGDYIIHVFNPFLN
jgi:hypothetical protein